VAAGALEFKPTWPAFTVGARAIAVCRLRRGRRV